MALLREVPKCQFCGEIIAVGIYQDQSNIPPMMRLIGDTFIRWDFKEHTCIELEKHQEKMKADLERLKKEGKIDSSLFGTFE